MGIVRNELDKERKASLKLIIWIYNIIKNTLSSFHFRVLKVPFEVFLFFSLNLNKLVEMVEDEYKACFGILVCGFLHAILRLLPLMAIFLAFLPPFSLFLRLSLRLRQSSHSHFSLSLQAIIIYKQIHHYYIYPKNRKNKTMNSNIVTPTYF